MSDEMVLEMKMLWRQTEECGWERMSQSEEFKERFMRLCENMGAFYTGLHDGVTKLENKMAEAKYQKNLNEETHKKFQMEYAMLRMKLNALKMKFHGFKPEVVETRATTTLRTIKRMTSFDLMTGNGYFLADNNGSEREAVFRWRGYPVVSRLQPLYDARGRAHLSLYFGRGDPEPFPANVRPLPNVYYVLTDAEGAKSACFNANYMFSAGCFLNFRHDLLQDYLSHTSVQVYVEPPAMTRLVHSYDGTLHWTIDKYSDRKRMEIDGVIRCQESPYFYTGAKGYRVRVHVCLDGEGAYKGRGLTARVSFLTGAFDQELSGDFPHETTVAVVHPLHPVHKMVKMEKIGAEKCYALDLCENEELIYLVQNDALLINVVIKAV